MRRSMTTAFVLTAACLCFAAPALGLNCDQARKYAATGRSAEDIADTMVADPGEVKKCLNNPANTDSKGSKAAGSTSSAGAAGEKMGDKDGDQPPSAKNPN